MILEVRGVTKSFGGIRAVDRCSLSIGEGTITGLIGPNGAGKTTLFNLIAGQYAPDEGTVLFRGRRIEGLPAYDMPHQGLVKTFQIPREFGNLTVVENLMVAAPGHPGESPTKSLLGLRRVWSREDEIEARARAILDFVGLGDLSGELARNLSGGQKKLLELARALILEPEVLLLDEPVAGVNPVLAERLMERIETLRQQGTTIFLIEHDMNVVMRSCDRVIVMHEGRPIADGKPEEVRANPQVIGSYLGG